MITDFIGYLNLFAGIAQILIGFLVFYSDPKDKIKRYYILSAIFLGFWSLAIFFYSNPFFLSSTIWLKIVYTMAYCMTLGLILFARVYPKELKQKFKTFLIIIAMYMAVIIFLLWTTDLVVQSTSHIEGTFNSYATMGPLYLAYGLAAFVTAVYVVGHYLGEMKNYSGLERKQIQYYVVGGILMLIPVILFDFAFPLVWENTAYYKYGTIGNALWTGIVGYSIAQTRFLDTRLVIGRFVGILLKTVLLLGSLLLLIYFVVPLWGISFSIGGLVKLAIVSLFLVLLVQGTFGRIEDFLSRKLVYVKYHPVQSLRELINKNSDILDFNEIGKNLVDFIDKSLRPGFIVLVLFDNNNKGILYEKKGDVSVREDGITGMLDIWGKLNSNRILIYSELKSDKKAGKRIIDEKRESILAFMKENSIEVLCSVKEPGKFEGVLMLGENYNRDVYSVGDVEFLDNIVQNAQMSLARAYLYLELRQFNQTLQQKVNEQTKELQATVKELQEARRKEQDMIDIMGHELRTPATVVKLNADLLGGLSNDIVNNKDKFETYIKRIKTAVENEIKLINTLLSSAKLEGDKIELNPEEVDIVTDIDMSVHGHAMIAKAKGLELINKTDPNTPRIFADHARTIEVLNNLVDNAVKYTENGSIEISTSYTDDTVSVSVKDTGKGIPKEEISKLGQKFYRISNYIENGGEEKRNLVRPGGTGLGLYVSFSLVEKMGGKMNVESEVGKGSIFTFTLPRANGQVAQRQAPRSNDMFERLGLRQ